VTTADCHNEGTVSNVEKLIVEFKDSLERESDSLRQTMQQGFSRINDRLADSIERDVVKLNR
jgi:hypothetical protein